MPKVEEPKKDKGKEKEKAKKSKELVLPEDDGDLEDREIKWLEYMLKKEGGEDSDGLDGMCGTRKGVADGRYSRLRGLAGTGWKGYSA